MNSQVVKNQIIWTKKYAWDDQFNTYNVTTCIRNDNKYRMHIILTSKQDESSYINISTAWRELADDFHPSVDALFRYPISRKEFTKIRIDIICATDPNLQSIDGKRLFARFYIDYPTIVDYSEAWLICDYDNGFKIRLKYMILQPNRLEYYFMYNNIYKRLLDGIQSFSQLYGLLNRLIDKSDIHNHSEMEKSIYLWAANTLIDHFSKHYKTLISEILTTIPAPIINIIAAYLL